MKAISKDEVIRRLGFGERVPRNWEQDYCMKGWRNKKTQEFIRALEVYEYQIQYTCQLCDAVTPDIRHLTLDCFYELKEVSPKFKMRKQYFEDGRRKWVYTILICKGCRAIFMFDYLAPFIDNAKKVRQEKNIDGDGIICLNG